MNPEPSALENPMLPILSVVRGLLPEIGARYERLRGATPEAIRKRLEREAAKGLLSTSNLPSGRQVFRLSRLGVQQTGAPPSWAASPTPGILAEMLSVSAVAWNTAEYRFPRRSDFQELVKDLGGADVQIPARLATSRFVLRTLKNGQEEETRLEYWLAELRPAEDLAKRAEIVAKNLKSTPPFAKLAQLGLLGISIPVPSDGVRATLSTHRLSLPTNIVVVQEMNHLSL